MTSLNAASQVFAVIGDPIKHSLSPLIHNGWLRAAGENSVYVGLNLTSTGKTAEADIASLHSAGLAGLNVTLPHKLSALSCSIEQSPEAISIGAANTLVRLKKGWRAHNTDAVGFLNSMDHALEGQPLKNKSVLVIGAGGAARAVVWALNHVDADIAVANRTVSRAQELVTSLAPHGRAASLTELTRLCEEADIVVNATSLGHGQSFDWPIGEGRGRLFYDLSYGSAAKVILDPVSALGWRTEDGLRMLVEQAREAFRLWLKIDPNPHTAYEMCHMKLEDR